MLCAPWWMESQISKSRQIAKPKGKTLFKHIGAQQDAAKAVVAPTMEHAARQQDDVYLMVLWLFDYHQIFDSFNFGSTLGLSFFGTFSVAVGY